MKTTETYSGIVSDTTTVLQTVVVWCSVTWSYGKLSKVNENVALTIGKLPGIRGDLV